MERSSCKRASKYPCHWQILLRRCRQIQNGPQRARQKTTTEWRRRTNSLQCDATAAERPAPSRSQRHMCGEGSSSVVVVMPYSLHIPPTLDTYSARFERFAETPCWALPNPDISPSNFTSTGRSRFARTGSLEDIPSSFKQVDYAHVGRVHSTLNETTIKQQLADLAANTLLGSMVSSHLSASEDVIRSSDREHQM
jgi:hypothetical protein